MWLLSIEVEGETKNTDNVESRLFVGSLCVKSLYSGIMQIKK